MSAMAGATRGRETEGGGYVCVYVCVGGGKEREEERDSGRVHALTLIHVHSLSDVNYPTRKKQSKCLDTNKDETYMFMLTDKDSFCLLIFSSFYLTKRV